MALMLQEPLQQSRAGQHRSGQSMPAFPEEPELEQAEARTSEIPASLSLGEVIPLCPLVICHILGFLNTIHVAGITVRARSVSTCAKSWDWLTELAGQGPQIMTEAPD